MGKRGGIEGLAIAGSKEWSGGNWEGWRRQWGEEHGRGGNETGEIGRV